MTHPPAIDPSQWQSIARGEKEAELLDRLGSDCYQVTSGLMATGNQFSLLYQPVADQLAIADGARRPVWPNGAPFAVCLTHDVDQVSRRNATMHLRRLKRQGRSLLTRFESRAWRGFQASASHFAKSMIHWGKDPLHCYQKWLEMEREVGAKSTFLFLPEDYRVPHYTDGNYRYSDVVQFDGQRCQVREMMREISDRGWEVGLHASWTSADDLDAIKHQKEQVERAIDSRVVSVRHHHLHCDIRRTPRIHQEAGLTVDSSFGMNDNIGFRHGTCYPTRLHDLLNDTPLSVWELPLVIQERALVETVGGGSLELALEWADRLTRRVEEVSGVMTLLWHPECLTIPSWVEVYRQLLRKLEARGAWFGTMKEITDWWRLTNATSESSSTDRSLRKPHVVTA